MNPIKLGKRLKHIEEMATGDYDHIWDCCCDHGFLGTNLLTRQAAKNIHFVDVIPKLMEDMENKLQHFHSDSLSNWKTYCLDAANLPLDKNEGKNLVIIAGVGGDLMIKLVSELHQKHHDLDIDYLLCPVHHQFAIRKRLIELEFSLKRESLVKENKRFYEVMLISSNKDINQPISSVGKQLWLSNSLEQANIAKDYLDKTLNHYQKIQQGNKTNVKEIIKAYQALRL